MWLRRAELGVRVLLVSGWAVAFVVAAAPPDATCTPEDPLVCSTDATGGLALALVVLAPVLLAVAPLLGCVAVALFGVLDVAFDSDPSARAGFGGLAVLAVVAAVGLVTLRGAQRRLARTDGPGAVVLPRLERDAVRDVRRVRAVAAAVLAVVGVVLALLYLRAATGVADRERTAQRLSAVVTTHVSDASALILDVAPGLGVPVRDADAYPVGSRLPVLVHGDGDDLWVRPVAEPEDVSWWLTFATAAGLGAGLLEASRWWARRRRTQIVTSRMAGPVLLWAPDGAGRAVLQADGVVLGAVAVSWVTDPDAPDQNAPDEYKDKDEDDDEDDDVDDDQLRADVLRAFAQAWRGEDGLGVDPLWQRATVLGDLRVGGWVGLVLEDGVVLGDGPVRAILGRHHPRPEPVGGAPAEDVTMDDLPGRPVPPTPAAVAALGDGEIVLTPTLRDRLLGAGLFVVAAALLAAVRSPLPEGFFQQVVLGVLGGDALVLGWRRWNRRVVADRRSVVVPGPWRTYEVPWQAVHGVRRDGDRLALAWADVAVVVGPFAGDGGADATAERAGGALAALRERAAALAAPDAPDAPVVSRQSPLVGLVAGYVLVVLTLLAG